MTEHDDVIMPTPEELEEMEDFGYRVQKRLGLLELLGGITLVAIGYIVYFFVTTKTALYGDDLDSWVEDAYKCGILGAFGIWLGIARQFKPKKHPY